MHLYRVRRHIHYRWKDVGKLLLELPLFNLHVAYELLSSKFATKVGLSSVGTSWKKINREMPGRRNRTFGPSQRIPRDALPLSYPDQ